MIHKAFNIDTDNRDALDLVTGLQHLRIIRRLSLPLLLLYALGECHAAQLTPEPTVTKQDAVQVSMKMKELQMWLTIGKRRFAVTLADTDAAHEFSTMLPITLDMEDLNGNEKHAELPKALPTDARRPGMIRNGDLMLWGSRTIVIFYKNFDTSYSYTRLGKIEDSADLPQELGRSNTQVEFSRN